MVCHYDAIIQNQKPKSLSIYVIVPLKWHITFGLIFESKTVHLIFSYPAAVNSSSSQNCETHMSRMGETPLSSLIVYSFFSPKMRKVTYVQLLLATVAIWQVELFYSYTHTHKHTHFYLCFQWMFPYIHVDKHTHTHPLIDFGQLNPVVYKRFLLSHSHYKHYWGFCLFRGCVCICVCVCEFKVLSCMCYHLKDNQHSLTLCWELYIHYFSKSSQHPCEIDWVMSIYKCGITGPEILLRTQSYYVSELEFGSRPLWL